MVLLQVRVLSQCLANKMYVRIKQFSQKLQRFLLNWTRQISCSSNVFEKGKLISFEDIETHSLASWLTPSGPPEFSSDLTKTNTFSSASSVKMTKPEEPSTDIAKFLVSTNIHAREKYLFLRYRDSYSYYLTDTLALLWNFTLFEYIFLNLRFIKKVAGLLPKSACPSIITN